MSRPPLKFIEWEDAFNGNHGWFALEEMPESVSPMIVCTVGFEVQRNAERVTLAMSWHDHGDLPTACDLFTIPVGMIRREKVLR